MRVTFVGKPVIQSEKRDMLCRGTQLEQDSNAFESISPDHNRRQHGKNRIYLVTVTIFQC